MKLTPARLRNKKGFSVLFVITISAIALIATMAVTDALVSTQRDVATQVSMNESTSVAENSLQYALALLNTAAAQGKLAGFPSPIPIPPAISGSGQVIVTMTQIPPSLFISAPVVGASPIYTQPWIGSPITTDYRLLSAQTQIGSYSRTINVVVGANPFAPNTPSTKSTPYFTGAVFANQLIDINGTSVSVENGSLPASQPILNSNSQIKLRGSTEIAGTVSAQSFDLPKITTLGGQVTSPIVDGNVSYAGTAPDNIKLDVGGSPTPGANVYGDGVNGGKPGATDGSATPSQAPPIQVQTPAGPTTFTPDGASGMIVSSSTSQPTDIGALNFASGQNLSIVAGQYVASSIYTSPASTITVTQPSGSKVAAPVQFYLQGDAQNSMVLQLQGNINSTGSASNLQIFYNGAQAIQVSKGEFHGQIYAPNASVTIDTSLGDFHGAVVANNVVLRGSGKFFFDPTTVSTSAGTSSQSPGAGYTLNNGNGAAPSSFQVLSWQEKTTGTP